MKLLSKTEVITGKAKDRRLEVNEGVKLATKVDALRKLAADEQANLIKFRNETLKKVREDLDAAMDERDAIHLEVQGLKQQRIHLQEPLDKEWHKVKEERKELTNETIRLIDKSDQLDRHEEELLIKAREIEIDKERVVEIKQLASQALSEANETKRRAEDILQNSIQKNNEVNIDCEVRLKNITQEESKLKFREVDLNSKEANLKLDEENIIRIKAQLEDQRQTLERAMKRIK